jgi:UPF0755 protein
MTTKAAQRKNKLRLLLIALIAGVVVIISILYIFIAPNVRLSDDKKDAFLYIYDNYSFEEVVTQLDESDYMLNTSTFSMVARLFDYDKKVRTGKYRLDEGMSNLSLVRKLRNGSQEPVQLTINNIRTRNQLVKLLTRELMADSAAITSLLTNDSLIAAYGFNRDNVVSVFIPNTYEFFWDTDARELFERMNKEYHRFWNDDRIARAAAIPLTPVEVITLASIVEEESNKSTEHPIIAGLYINRLKIGMPLQADPTVRFSLNDFTIKRVLFGHLRNESPYNTYRNKGLPPGPIRLPSINVIDAVLNYTQHDYLFMSAKETLNGEHNFARNGAEHMMNARKYQKALDARGIR